MADSLVRLRIDSSEYDQKLKRAAEGLQRYADGCRKVGGTLEVVEKDTLDYVKAIGQMETHSRTATGKLAEMKKAFVEFSSVYKNMTEQEKQSPMGKALAQSLDQLKVRISDSKKQLEDINRELNGSKFGQFGGIIDTLGQKMGMTGSITEMLTSKTAMLTGAIGAGIAIVTKSAEAWAAYNSELAKQDQITTVTTGLKGDEANRMTDMARALSDTYKVDFREAINAANTLMSQFGATSEETMQLLRDGMQGMIQGDGPKLLQMIQQFAPAFRDAGVSASQLIAVIQNSEGGLFTDQNMNAIVMGIKNIRLMTNATSEALAKLGIDGQKMSQQLSDGSLTVFDALKQVASAIQGVDSNSKAAGEVMQQVFGRQGVTAGTNLGKAIETLNTNLDQTKKKTGEVGDALAELQTANEQLNKAIRDCFEYDGWDQMAKGIQAKLVTALATVLDYIGKIKGSLTDFVGGGIKAGEQPKPEQKYSNGAYWERKDANGNVTSGRYWNNQQVSQSEYEKLRKSVVVPPGGNTPKGGGGKQTPDSLVGSIDAQTKKVQDLQKAWQAAANDSSRDDIKKQIEQAQTVLDVMNGKAKLTDITIKADTSEALEKLKSIEGVTIDPKDVTIKADTSEALEKLKSIEGVTIDPKDVTIKADTSEALAKIQQIDGVTIEPKTVKIEPIDIKSLAMPNGGFGSLVQDTFTRQQQGLTELKQKVKLELDTEALKTDTETLKTILKDSIQNGIAGMDFQLMGLGDEIAKGINVPDETWQKIIDQYNTLREKIGLEPINVDLKTGNTESDKNNNSERKTREERAIEYGKNATVVGAMSDLTNGVNGILGGIEQMGIEIPEGLKGIMSGISGVMTILTSINTVLGVIEGLQTVGVLPFFAHGGIAHAANGFVPGNDHSDNIPVMVSSGELILNKAQQGNLASQLQDSERGGYTPSHVSGEQIWIALNNFTRRTGRGELVTWK